jgi:hypothetical protein
MADFKIVQGDDKHIRVNFLGDSATQVAGFYFTSSALSLSKYFDTKVDDNWYLDISSEETSKLPVGTFNFDITARTLTGDLITGIYHGTVCVLEKDNKIE